MKMADLAIFISNTQYCHIKYRLKLLRTLHKKQYASQRHLSYLCKLEHMPFYFQAINTVELLNHSHHKTAVF